MKIIEGNFNKYVVNITNGMMLLQKNLTYTSTLYKLISYYDRKNIVPIVYPLFYSPILINCIIHDYIMYKFNIIGNDNQPTLNPDDYCADILRSEYPPYVKSIIKSNM